MFYLFLRFWKLWHDKLGGALAGSFRYFVTDEMEKWNNPLSLGVFLFWGRRAMSLLIFRSCVNVHPSNFASRLLRKYFCANNSWLQSRTRCGSCERKGLRFSSNRVCTNLRLTRCTLHWSKECRDLQVAKAKEPHRRVFALSISALLVLLDVYFWGSSESHSALAVVRLYVT